MNLTKTRTKLSAMALGLAFASVVMSETSSAESVLARDMEYRELKVAFDTILHERDQLRLALSEAQSTIESMRVRLDASNVESEIFKRQASQMKLRIGVLGVGQSGDPVSKLEQRLLGAVSELRIVTADKRKLSAALARMADSSSAYASATSAANPRSRLALEGDLRNAHSALESSSEFSLPGRLEPISNDDGTIISVNDDLSLVVVNVGSRQGVKVGMPFKVSRDAKLIATVRAVDVREKIFGAVVQTYISETSRIRFGDRLQMDAIQ